MNQRQTKRANPGQPSSEPLLSKKARLINPSTQELRRSRRLQDFIAKSRVLDYIDPITNTDPEDQRKARSHGQEHTPPSVQTSQLTRKNLRLLQKMLKQKYGEASGPSELTTITSGKSIPVSSPEFSAKALDQGILDPDSSMKASNIEQLRTYFEKYRGSPEPPESSFEQYRYNRDGAIPNETSVVVSVISKLFKPQEEIGYQELILNQYCTEFPANIGFNNGLSAAKPDLMQGFDRLSYLPFPIASELGDCGAILYEGPKSVVLPHFAAEFKGPNGSMQIAKSQSGYDGACLVYARNQALIYVASEAGGAVAPEEKRRAAVVTLTSDGNEIHFFGHFATESKKLGPRYHQCYIASANIMSSYEGFKRGRRMIRNAQEFAKEQAQTLRKALVAPWEEEDYE